MDCEFETEQGSYTNSVEAVPFETTFLDLNDFCLLKVFDHLDLFDVLNVRSTCRRLRTVSEMTANNFKVLCLDTLICHMDGKSLRLITACLHVILNFLNPMVENIQSYTYTRNIKSINDAFFKVIQKHDLPKLKSLRVCEASHLRFIKNKNIEKLDIEHVKSGDLRKYLYGITKVKHLTFITIRHCVRINELIQFFDNNPNIERLALMNEVVRPLNANFFSHLKNLKMLKYRIGEHSEDLQYVSQIESLVELVLASDYKGYSINNSIERFLTTMAQKQTLKSIVIRHIYFDNLVHALSKLNLESLHYVFGNDSFVGKLLTEPFSSLKDLNVFEPIDIVTIFKLIKHLTALEDVRFTVLRRYNRGLFRKKLNQLVAVKRDRPELRMHFVTAPTQIKVS